MIDVNYKAITMSDLKNDTLLFLFSTSTHNAIESLDLQLKFFLHF